jgi:hypothetical protein
MALSHTLSKAIAISGSSHLNGSRTDTKPYGAHPNRARGVTPLGSTNNAYGVPAAGVGAAPPTAETLRRALVGLLATSVAEARDAQPRRHDGLFRVLYLMSTLQSCAQHSALCANIVFCRGTPRRHVQVRTWVRKT